jgi:hypothetical protein
MRSDDLYSPPSMLRFQVSLLHLGVALQRSTSGDGEIKAEPLDQALHLKDKIE